MTLRVVYRSYGGENLKRRPAYYSKLLTLTSLARAAARVPDVEVVFLNDGPVPAERLTVMERAGRVVQLGDEPQGMRASYRAALELATGSDWPDEDVVFLVEDDYLFTEEALVALAEAAAGLPEASYFSVYGVRPDPDDPESVRELGLPRGWRPGPDRVVGSRTWFHQASITSTFAGRLGAVRADMPIFLQCMRPFRRRFFDHETCLLYQGVPPYHGREFFFGLDDFEPSARGVVRALVLVPFRIALNLRAHRQTEPHLLYAVTPNLATHLEHPVISPDADWEAVADEVLAWARTQGLPDATRPADA
ncbi:hypothetical protein GC722_03375 [Auraticoccus sp. F435]|uniref:Glycosyltransferase n=1 Tax=Auraticoccus cholistanensis TaxID=2656650 RepID=A0A6A9UQQ5_9ACTN|nr:hypothetical protein [Auraticoccus cholistanensis]MVA75073.1 hypothetical protein [Auraticoccus cholistanensis]